MFGMMGTERVSAESSAQISLDDLLKSSARAQPDVRVIATRGANNLSILVWNYNDDAVAAVSASISLSIDGLPRPVSRVRVAHYRIDQNHSNSYTAWKAMGSPQQPSAAQIARLKSARRLQLLAAPASIRIHHGHANLPFTLPRQGLSLLQLDWRSQSRAASAKHD